MLWREEDPAITSGRILRNFTVAIVGQLAFKQEQRNRKEAIAKARAAGDYASTVCSSPKLPATWVSLQTDLGFDGVCIGC